MAKPKQQYFSLAGIPLVGGKIYTYAAGTSAPKQTFTDAGAAQPNPIPLNSRGEPTNAIFWDGAYRVDVRDALGNLVYTVDNYQTPAMPNDLSSGANGLGAGLIGFIYASVYPIGSLGKWLQNLALGAGASFIGFIQDGAGAVATTVQAALRESVSATRFGLSTGAADNSAALARIVAYVSTFSGTGLLPRILVPAGTYNYLTSPNWGVTGLCLEAIGEVIFQHNGAGIAFNIDGGAAGPGVVGVRILGNLRVSGNAATTKVVYLRAVHHSTISVRPINGFTALETAWCVCNRFLDFRCSPVGYPAFTVTPTNGIILGKRNAGELTSACIFENPIIEGVISYGINLQDAIQNTFIGGTSESNGGGLFITANSSNNLFVKLDMEFNASADVFSQGAYNTFIGLLSSTLSTFNGLHETVQGGLFNSIVNGGDKNIFRDLNYSTNFGAFTDGGTKTVKSNVRNSVSNALDPELQTNPLKLTYIDGPVGNNTIIGSDDQVGGGSANNLAIYHYGAGEIVFSGGGFARLRLSQTGVGFNGAPPLAIPNVTGSCGGNVALSNLCAALGAAGNIVNSTTP